MPSPTIPDGLAESMRRIAADCETDAYALDDQPFSGRTMGENFGILYAMVQAVARGVEALATAATSDV